MKRTAFLFALLLFMLTLAFCVNAKDNLPYSFMTENNEVTITKAASDISGCIIIPNQIDNLPVTKIGDGAFADCVEITDVVFPTTLKSIESNAFRNCKGITKLIIPGNVKTLGYESFWGCCNINELHIETGVERIGENALRFSSEVRTHLDVLIIPDSITSIERRAFDVDIDELFIGSGVADTYCDEAFVYCNVKDVFYNFQEEQLDDSLSYFSGKNPRAHFNVNANNHEWKVKESLVIAEANTTITTYICSCGHTKIETNETEHYVITDEAVLPTCIASGLTEGKHCLTCGEVIVKQEIVEALGHIEIIDNEVEPTCYSTGLSEGKHCSRCNKILVPQETLDSINHVDKNKDHLCDSCGRKISNGYIDYINRLFSALAQFFRVLSNFIENMVKIG